MPLDIARIRALCFDVDGTLNDTDDQFVEQAEPFFRRFRRWLPGQDYHLAARRFVMWSEAPGNLLIGLPDRLGLDAPLAAFSSWLSQKHKASIHHFRPINGVPEMIQQLSQVFPLAVVSARDEASTRDFLRQSGLEQYFVCVAGALTVAHTKPYPDPVLWAARQMNVPAASCLMIGDTTVDIRAGRAAGAQTAGVLCGFGEQTELQRCGADLIVPGTPDLLEVLLGNRPA